MRFSLRLKLTLVSLLLFLIPLTGFRFSELIKQDLMKSRKETLLFSARAVASALTGRTGLFDREIFHSLNASRDLYLYQLSNPIRINGKPDDWLPQLNEAREFGEADLITSAVPYDYASLHYRHLTGVRGDYLYAIFLVTDDNIVYRQANSLRVDTADHLQIAIEDPDGQMHQYIVTAKGAGWVNGFQMTGNDVSTIPERVEPRIQGMWTETMNGYVLELRMPMAMIGHKLAFAIADIDNENSRNIAYLVGTATANDSHELGWLISPSDTIADILQPLNRPESRILIVDLNRRIRASYGSLTDTEKTEVNTSLLAVLSGYIYRFLSPLSHLFTQPFTYDFKEPPLQPSTLDIQGIQEALQGTASVTRYAINDGNVEIMAAITPLQEADSIIGAVVVEQTTHSILALQNKVIEESITLTVFAFIVGATGLLIFASRLSSRIRRLGNQATGAISGSGQILETIEPVAAQDEIGDLSRTLTSMLNQLKLQIEYREKMADNLEHEMRTPLAGISASLKNIQCELQNPPPHITEFLNWALEDVSRLETLLSAVRDATSLHEALSRDFKEDFDLDTAIDIWLTHSWHAAFPDVDFVYHRPTVPVSLHGDPARIKQMLDKLIENGVSFHTPLTPIEISLEENHGTINLAVTNQGPIIPEEQKKQIFNSMVSYRAQKSQQPHLGLGLYIVRTIVLHHHGQIAVTDAPNSIGTRFTLTFYRS